MLWKGRRQSSNIEDGRSVTNITLEWKNVSESPGRNTFPIFANGSTPAAGEISLSGSNLRIELYAREYMLYQVTSAQKDVLREILRVVAKSGKQVTITSASAELSEMANGFYRNFK